MRERRVYPIFASGLPRSKGSLPRMLHYYSSVPSLNDPNGSGIARDQYHPRFVRPPLRVFPSVRINAARTIIYQALGSLREVGERNLARPELRCNAPQVSSEDRVTTEKSCKATV